MKFPLAVGIWATHVFQALTAAPPTGTGPISVSCFCPKNLSPCTTCVELLVDEKYTCKTECTTKCFDLLNDPNNCGKCGNVVCNPLSFSIHLSCPCLVPYFNLAPITLPFLRPQQKREGKLSALAVPIWLLRKRRLLCPSVSRL